MEAENRKSLCIDYQRRLHDFIRILHLLAQCLEECLLSNLVASIDAFPLFGTRDAERQIISMKTFAPKVFLFLHIVVKS